MCFCHCFHCFTARGVAVAVFVSVYKIDSSAAVPGALAIATLDAAGVVAPSAADVSTDSVAINVFITSAVTLQVLVFLKTVVSAL